MNPFPEIAKMIREVGGETLKLCFQCATCTGTCPWNNVREFPVRRIIRLAQLGLSGYEEDVWFCTTCLSCVVRCPRGVEISDVLSAIRSVLVSAGMAPSTVKSALGSLRSDGNPWGGESGKRGEWQKEFGVKEYTPDTEYFLFPCCTPIYDPRTKKTLRDAVNILKSLGVDFGAFSTGEVCCGDVAEKTGDDELFSSLRETNLKLFREHGVRKIITLSPHCYNTFTKLYGLEVKHITQVLAEAIANLRFRRDFKRRVVYHDPCYLGRHNGIYDEPRKVLKAVPGVELLEFERSKDMSLCCGGGGGGMWMDIRKGERFVDMRVEEALGIGAEVIATACPFCTLMFQDSVSGENKIEVKDISEILREVV